MKTTAVTDFDECVRLLTRVASGWAVPVRDVRKDICAFNVRITKDDMDAIRNLVRRIEREA